MFPLRGSVSPKASVFRRTSQKVGSAFASRFFWVLPVPPHPHGFDPKISAASAVAALSSDRLFPPDLSEDCE
ncbi:MAG: hypothetical protein AB7O91_02515 [Sphingomonas sp.]